MDSRFKMSEMPRKRDSRLHENEGGPSDLSAQHVSYSSDTVRKIQSTLLQMRRGVFSRRVESSTQSSFHGFPNLDTAPTRVKYPSSGRHHISLRFFIRGTLQERAHLLPHACVSIAPSNAGAPPTGCPRAQRKLAQAQIWTPHSPTYLAHPPGPRTPGQRPTNGS